MASGGLMDIERWTVWSERGAGVLGSMITKTKFGINFELGGNSINSPRTP